MIEDLELSIDAPTSWSPMAPTVAQAAALSALALHADDLSLTLGAWRTLAKDCASVLPFSAPYPGYLASPLRSLSGHPLQALLPDAPENAWLKCDCELPLSQSLSDRGMGFAVLSLVGKAMMAEGLAHMGQPLGGVAQAATRAWLSAQQLVVHGPGRDALAAARICRALGLPVKAVLKGNTPLALTEALQDCGVDLSEAWGDASLGTTPKRSRTGDSSRWWLDTTESLEAYQGYACAALELKHQLFGQDVQASDLQSVLVYVSSGNCLGAAALLRGLKAVFGPAVQAVLVEDSHDLQALPSLCRWPQDGERGASSRLGNLALTGVVEVAITVDARHRKLARLPLQANVQAQYSDETIGLFAAAAEHLSQQTRKPSTVVFWLSDCALA